MLSYEVNLSFGPAIYLAFFPTENVHRGRDRVTETTTETAPQAQKSVPACQQPTTNNQLIARNLIVGLRKDTEITVFFYFW